MSNHKKFKTKNSSESFWAGYAKQTIDFHNALGELIDNALSATKTAPYIEEKEPAVIEIVVEEIEENGRIQVTVADAGVGVSENNLTSENNIFNLGYQPQNRGLINEHGFGLKNALALLTSGFQEEFTFISHHDNNFYLVKGPIAEDMELEYSDKSTWSRDLKILTDTETGVKVIISVKRDYFNTLYPRGKNFTTLIPRLGEHLGVMYSNFIDAKNTIYLRYKEFGAADYTQHKIPSIHTPFLKNATSSTDDRIISIEYKGQEYKANYIRGILDDSIKSEDAENKFGWPYPLRIHFQGSNARGGITLINRKRILKTGVLKEIWPETAGKIEYNNFLGVLEFIDPIATTNNKADLDPHNNIWSRFKELLQDDENNYRPETTTKKQTEETLRKKIIKQISNTTKLTGKNLPSKKRVWDGDSDIDIYYEKDKKTYLIETKVTSVKVLDVYQLLMYWDGLVEEGKTPYEATLIGNDIKKSVLKAIDSINKRKDGNNKNYNLKAEEASQWDIN